MKEALYYQERQAVQNLSWRLEGEVAERWNACRFSRRFMAYQGKSLVVYKLDANTVPSDVRILTCEDFKASARDGMQSVWKIGSERIEVAQVPVEVGPGVFFWHSFFSDVQYTPYKGVYGLRASLILCAPCNPDKQLRGKYYVQELAKFNAEFPA